MADYNSSYTGQQIDNGIAKASKLPNITGSDEDKIVICNVDGNFDTTEETLLQMQFSKGTFKVKLTNSDGQQLVSGKGEEVGDLILAVSGMNLIYNTTSGTLSFEYKDYSDLITLLTTPYQFHNFAEFRVFMSAAISAAFRTNTTTHFIGNIILNSANNRFTFAFFDTSGSTDFVIINYDTMPKIQLEVIKVD